MASDTGPAAVYGGDTRTCRYGCGAEFPRGNATAQAVHETFNCPDRPDDDQRTLAGFDDGQD